MAFCAYCGNQVADAFSGMCPACGNPVTGAPRPAYPTGGRNAGTIAVIAIVLAVLAIPMAGILAAIAIPNFVTAMQRSKQKRTMVEIRTLAQEVERQAATGTSYPETLSTPKDGWGTVLRYECTAREDRPCAGYAITSAGKDMKFEHEAAYEYVEGSTDKFDCDVVFANGAFLQYPEGAQR